MKMRRINYIVFASALAICAAGCNTGSSETSADTSFQPSTAKSSKAFDKPKPAPKVTIPAGTHLRVALIDGVSTNGNSSGDQFMASLAEPVIVDGKMLLEKGTKVRGRVVDVEESGRVKGRASIRLTLSEIVRDNGKTVDISTKPFVAVAETTKKRDAGIIAGGAGIGAVIGAIAGGGKGAAVGTAVGAGAGTGTVLATKGKDIHYAPETRLNFTLASPIEI
jgi:hypothetical protein